MRPSIPMNRLLLEISEINKESQTLADLLAKVGDRIKAYSPTISALPKELYSRSTGLSQLDEYIINTGKPYIDNSLSGYSAFPEFINHYNNGFRSCLVLPIKDDNRSLGSITLLSNEENAFDNEAVDALVFLSEQVSKEASLKIEKEKSNTVAKYFDASFNSIIPQMLVDRNGVIVKANKAVTGVLDRTGKELAGKSMADFIAFPEGGMESLKSGRPTEAKAMNPESSQLAMSSSQINERLMHIVLYDMTDTKNVEEKAEFLGNSDDETFIITDNDTKILWVSGSSQRVINEDADALVGEKFSNLLHGDSETDMKLRELHSGSLSASAKLNLGNGVILPVKLKAYKVPSGIAIIVSRDYNAYIDALKKGIDEIIGLSSDPIMIIDESGYIKSQNKSSERLLKYNGDISGVPISSLCADTESANSISNAMALVKKNDIITDVFVNMRGSSGSEPIPFIQNMKSIRDENSNLRGFIIFGRELRTKKLIEDLQDERQKLEREATKYKSDLQLKDQFIFDISHELRTPVTNITGFSKLLLQGEFGELTAEQKEYMDIIIKELDRLAGMINQVLDLIKISSGKMRLVLQQVNFNDLMSDPSIRSLKEACQEKGLGFNCNIEFNVPTVTADPNRLIQVFVNLIGNATKFTEKGSISIRASRKAKNVLVEITDTGIGISEEDRHKLFKKFHQVQRKGLTKQEGSGTGLGLAITKEIVNKHYGKIGVISEGPGKGSTFWFTIPIAPKAKKKQEQQKAQDKEAGENQAQKT